MIEFPMISACGAAGFFAASIALSDSDIYTNSYRGVKLIQHKVNINGIDVNAVYSEDNIREIFLPMLEKFTEMQKEKGRRILVMLAAPPGAGKSTLLTFLEKLSHDNDSLIPLQAIGMDGFHRRQEYLTSHTTLVDGEELPMVKIKGAPITFDLEKLSSKIIELSSGKNCGWPTYDRHLHNPTEDAVFVDSSIVLLEGNYLLLDTEGWRELSSYADYTISVKAPRGLLHKRLLERKILSGSSYDEALRHVDGSDMRNVDLCLEKGKVADLELMINDDGSYTAVV